MLLKYLDRLFKTRFVYLKPFGKFKVFPILLRCWFSVCIGVFRLFAIRGFIRVRRVVLGPFIRRLIAILRGGVVRFRTIGRITFGRLTISRLARLILG